MPVGEVCLGAFLEVLFDRLADRRLLSLLREDGIDLQLKQWKKKLFLIQAVLDDAEDKELCNKAVKMWLDDLRDLSYDMDDVLDEYATRALESKLSKEQSTSHITDYFSSVPGTLVSKLNMQSQIEQINGRLEDLCEERDYLGLEKIACRASTAVLHRPPTTCLPTEPIVYGRDDDKAKILEMVLKEELGDVNFCVIPIVGMGGIGKTTLAREVYNDKAVSEFHPKAWVCVSDDFNVIKISKAILESITSFSCNLTNLNQIQIELQEQVRDKKFLLVLDDVWSKDYGLWEILKSPFMVGASGSRIIITTRIEDVALTMGHVKPHNVGLLTGEDCWAIFEKHAFQRTKFYPHQTSNSIRKRVVEKCKGLPLAARTLGGLLRCKQRDGEWENILNSNIWDLQDNTEILAVLKLSYHHLPSHLKRCFAYCAIFPKDYEFTEKELVFLWMAEGLIQTSKVKEEQEDTGSLYFQDLLARSIFQESSSRYSSKYVMHDLVNDLAQWASGETSFCLQDKSKVNVQSERLKRVRYLSYTCGMSNCKNKFEVFHEATNLRTFLPILLDTDITANIVPLELLLKFKKLRMLSLSYHNITELPDLIGDLRHLRYINLSGSKISSLPESINLLLNLQILILRWCFNIKKLPSMGNLINLRHLDLEMVKLMEMPSGMESWKYLQTLPDFFVGKGSGSSLEVLKYLKFLRGKLRISELKNITAGLQEEILSDKEKLDELWLKWGYGHGYSRSEEVEKNVLDMLRPHKNIKELSIEGYGGTHFPTWLGDLSFSLTSLEKLKICDCQKLQFLFEDREEIGTPSSLVIHRENIDNTSTPLLKHLSISFCSSLMCLSPKGHLAKTFKHLECLKIKCCDSLICIVRGQLPPSLRQLSVENCESLQCLLDDREDVGVPFSSSVMHMENIDSTNISQLEDLNIFSCLSITCLSSKGQLPTTLKHLCISWCPSLSTLSSMGQLPMLKKIEVLSCSELKILFLQGQLPGVLEYLYIWSCPKLELITERLHNNRSLKDIFICDCENLKSMPDGLDSLGCLRRISLINCPSLVSFSGGKLLNSNLEVSVETYGKFEALPNRIHSHRSSKLNRGNLKLYPITSMDKAIQNPWITDCPKLNL